MKAIRLGLVVMSGLLVLGALAQQAPPAASVAPQQISVPSLHIASAQTTRTETQCKNCPYTSCINSGYMNTGTVLDFGCWTRGEFVGGDNTWLKFQYGLVPEDYCYIARSDLASTTEGDQSEIPYCGSKSEIHFYLPTLQTRSVYYTECSLCPFRDCEGVAYYQPGAPVPINCIFDSGWNQLSPLRPNGTQLYYRTPDNCYVSTSVVEELPGKPYITVQVGPTSTVLTQPALPSCGPVPFIDMPPQPS